MTGAYYNEINGYAAEHLRNLIKTGQIAPGDVDERDIRDVRPDDLRGYTQCHFFAGIGGWPLALRLAGYPDDRPVWTGSCPCQPFSAAGKGLGFADERHIWPFWDWLITQCRPSTIFGEQVASKDVEPWIDLVFSDLEAVGYACGTNPFPSASVGAPHIRDRAYFVAHSDIGASGQGSPIDGRRHPRSDAIARPGFGSDGMSCELGHADSAHQRGIGGSEGGAACRSEGEVCRHIGQRHGDFGDRASATPSDAAGPTNGFWRAADWLLCRDEKWRPVEPGTFPLVDGLPAGMGKLSAEQRRLAELAGLDAASLKRAKAYRVGTLRGYGNAINPHQAAEFIRAAREAIEQ